MCTPGPKFTGSISATKFGRFVTVTMELTPSSDVENGDLVASGLPATASGVYASLATANGNYSARIDTDGTLKIYYPSYTTAARIDCTLSYVCTD